MAENKWELCQKAFESNRNSIKIDICEQILELILTESKSGSFHIFRFDIYILISASFCLNMYDIRLKDTAANQGCGMHWPEGLDRVTRYLSVNL